MDGPHGQQIFTLQSTDQPYRVLAERMSEGAATLTPEGTILFCNQRLAEMAGLPAVRLVGSQFVSLLEGAEQSRFRELVETASEHDVRAEGHLRHLDGSMLPVQLSLSQIPIEYSRHGICLVATDLSDRKRVEEEVRRLNMELEGRVTRRTVELVAANQDMEAFSYGVAHDLRAPLRHVHGFAEILRRDLESVLSTDGQHSLDRIIDGILQMEKLLEDLLNFSRLGGRMWVDNPLR